MKKSKKTACISAITLFFLGLFLFIYANQSTSIPILLYHHINYIDRDSLSVTPENFEEQMKYLFSHNYKSLFLDELKNIIEKGEKIPSKTVVITFDDGYLDNWVYAYPILKKYKIKATIFVITAFMKNNKKYRPNLEDVWKGSAKRTELPEFPDHNTVNLAGVESPEKAKKYFLAWEEMKQMIDSGIIDIQSHTHTHSSYFISSKIIDFNHKNHWTIASSTGGDTRPGIPVYEQASGIIGRRFFDDKKLRDHMADFVKRSGGEKFFKKNKKYKDVLMQEIKRYQKNNKLEGFSETLNIQEKRIKKELMSSLSLIKKNLNSKFFFIAWPWGEHNAMSLKLAKETGYIGALTTRKGSNKINSDVWNLKRIKAWPRGNWWFGLRLYVYSNGPLGDFFSIFTD